MNKSTHPTRRAVLGAAVAVPLVVATGAHAEPQPVSREAWDAALAEFRAAWSETSPVPYAPIVIGPRLIGGGRDIAAEDLERRRAYTAWTEDHYARIEVTRNRLLSTPAPDAEALAIRLSLAAMNLPHNAVLAHSIGADMARLFGRG
jgi:hypothetical protein